MGGLITDSTWQSYKDAINKVHLDFNQDDIIWKRSKGGLDRDGEDNLGERFDSITIKGLFDYNAFRTWPTNFTTDTGEWDRETTALLLNAKYLGDNGWLTTGGIFDFKSDKDRFIHKNIQYKCGGFTPLSQAKDEPLLFMLILQRDKTETGKEPI